MTAAELLHLRIPHKVTELVRGRLMVRDLFSTRHGLVTGALIYSVSLFLERHPLGVVLSRSGFHLCSNPDTVRAPDLAFIAANRASLLTRDGYTHLAPDLVAEVLDENDRPAEVLWKIADWLEAGTRIVWVIDPLRDTARIHRADGSIEDLGLDDMLYGDHVLRGYAVPLRELLS